MAELNAHGAIIICTELELKPVLSTFVLNFSGKTIERVKNQTTGEYESVPHYFSWEIWDSAAKFLSENAKRGDKIIIHSATPREHKWVKDGKNFSKVVFRINKFELCGLPPQFSSDTNEPAVQS